MTVLLFIPTETEPTWIGFWDGECWRNPEGMQFSEPVAAWAPMPAGPTGLPPAGPQ